MQHFLRSKPVLILIALILLGIGPFTVLVRQQPAHAASGDWSAFLFNNARSGFNGAETIINQKTAPDLKVHWTHTISALISAEPVEANGMLYWGGWDGVEHASRLTDGTDVWSVNLGTSVASCVPTPHGVSSTAGFAYEQIGRVQTPVLFVGGGSNATFYAFNANTGAVIWQTVLSSQTRCLQLEFASPAQWQSLSRGVFADGLPLGAGAGPPVGCGHRSNPTYV